jgi:hypothetical protein
LTFCIPSDKSGIIDSVEKIILFIFWTYFPENRRVHKQDRQYTYNLTLWRIREIFKHRLSELSGTVALEENAFLVI